MSDPAACCVLLCPSSEQSRSLRSVCFFDFPHPNDPRYPIWIERSLRAKDWTPSPTSKICSRHFRPSDILALPLADGSGRTEKRLKYDALPCVFEDLPQSMRPQTDVVPRADSPEIIDIPTSSKKRSADSLHEITCDEVKKETEDFVSASDAAAEVSTDVKSNFLQGDLKALWSDSTSARPTEPVNSSVVIPSAKKPKKDVMHEVTSDEVKRETDDSVIASDAVAEISTNVKSNFSHENLKALLSDSTSARATEPLSLSAAIPSAKIARQDPSPVVTDVLPNFSHPNLKELLNNPQNTNATGSVSSPVAIPSTAGLFPPVISSSNPIPMPSVCALAQKIVDGRLMVMQHCAQHIPPDFPAFTNADEARNCCVPGCRIDRNNNLQGRIRFEAFPTDLRLRAEWVKWVAFSGFWQPAPYSVVCSLHFLPSDYDYIGTVLCLKPTAIPVHTGCRNGLMRKLNGPCPFSRVCAICGCWRAIKQTIYHYKSASRLAFIPFPQEPNQRQKWLAACSEAPGENALYACERHFVPADIVTRFEQLGEMKFVLRRRNDILPCPSQLLCSLPVENQVRPPPVNLQINVSPRLFPLNTTNNSQVRSVANVFIEAVLQSPPSGTVPATPSSVLIRSAANSVSVGGATFMPSPNQTALPVVASPIVPPPTDQVKPGSSRNAQLEDAAASAKPPPHPVEEANIVCCVPGCQNVCQSKRQHIYLPGKPIFFPFVGVGDPRYRTWTQRLRYNSSWIPDSSERICSDHFNQSEIESSKSDASLVRKALPSQLSCMASLCGFTAADMATGAIGCAACGLRPPVDRQPKASEKLMFFRAPPSALDALWKKWVDFCNQRRNDIDWTLIGADTPWYLCENHFEGQYIEAAEGLGSIVSNSEAVPSWTYSLDVNYTDPKLATSTSYLYGHFLLRKGVFCCVPGCETILKKKDSVAGKFFEFIPPTDERYCDWLRMVRYNVSWVPERRARICLEHFPASAIKLKCRKKGSQKSACLLDSAFPTQLSCMESLCSFTPADLMAGKEGCAVCGLRPFASHRRLKTSEKLEFYRAPSGEMREKWIEFCKSQRNDIDWTSISEKTPWFLCENHFEAQKAVPSVPFSIYIKPRDLESAATAQGELAKMHERKRKKCAPVCCVPGCRKYAWNEIPSPPISFYHFHNGYIAKVNRSEWINRIRSTH
ncbi:uncharacterized protein LOC129585454 isoform X2 [Paramacrobiotus metropolitanus]|uniref:uncharacterized protein LOC129585454 isoform X2 n=1 Tax=Paramacrobiotus metropolitanus TaxID=2943436 RepID=UPI00244600DD|nr:uncharacterized protein LOC129585454 isoform X2 [Paramacrobiotus metropolitanus]